MIERHLSSKTILDFTVRVVPGSSRISSSFGNAYSVVRTKCMCITACLVGVRFDGTDRVLSNAHAVLVLDMEDGTLLISSTDELIHGRCVTVSIIRTVVTVNLHSL